MRVFRRRLASCALALTALQLALLFAAPVAACCRGGASHAAVQAAPPADSRECCPAGAHAPGECPLHRSSQTTAAGAASRAAGGDCRMQCDAPHGPEFLLGAIGVLPAPQVTAIAPIVSTLVAAGAASPAGRPTPPDAPPPKFL